MRKGKILFKWPILIHSQLDGPKSNNSVSFKIGHNNLNPEKIFKQIETATLRTHAQIQFLSFISTFIH